MIMNWPKRNPFRLRPYSAVVCVAVSMLLTPTWLPGASAAEPALSRADALSASHAETGATQVLSPQARHLAHWIAKTGDHAGSPFIIVDKKRASVFVFEPNARLRAHSPVLLGSAVGDDSVPGIGSRPIPQILPSERTTPAGRFVAERGQNAQGEDVVWVDYDAAVSMHRVRKGNPVERRAERLASPTIVDNRISYGCINVPVVFYESFIQPIFAQRKALVYVLPESKPMREVFSMSPLALAGTEPNRALRSHGGTVQFDQNSAMKKP